MNRRKTFLRKSTKLRDAHTRNLRLKRLKNRKAKRFSRNALQFVVLNIAC